MNIPKPKINTNWLLLAAAVLLGIGAVFLSNSLIKRRFAEIEAAANRGKETVSVVVAKRDLERGDPLTAAVVAVRQIPKEYVHQSAVRPEQFGSFERQRLAAPLRRGETLLTSHTEGNGSNVFSATLKKGWRALTFEVDSVNSISGMLRPGDRIDLIYSSKGRLGEDTTVPLLSNVSVLATDQMVTKRDETTGKERSFSTITLEVSPFDADRIIVAKAAGQLTAVLRHPDDEAANRTRALSAASLTGGGAALHDDGRMVEYIVGGGGGKAEVQMSRVVSTALKEPVTLQ
jgi:pilus assembly protein CpaB